jgi:hypothetical protein
VNASTERNFYVIIVFIAPKMRNQPVSDKITSERENETSRLYS